MPFTFWPALLALLSLTDGTVVRQLRTRNHDKQNIAMLLAGPHDHTWMNVPHISLQYWSQEFHDHMVSHLLGRFHVSMFITCEESQKKGWEDWSRGFTDLATKQISLYTRLPFIDETRFSSQNGLCKHPDCLSYWYQYTHMYNSYLAMLAYEFKQGIKFDFVVKARNDFLYKPDNYLEPWWFDHMDAQTLIVPSTQFHRTDRWAEPEIEHDKDKYMGPKFRGTPDKDIWPTAMCDQIVFGSRPAMLKFFEFIWSRHKLPPGYYEGIEGIIAWYLQSENVSIMTAELQVSQPGGKGKFVNGYNGFWVESPCGMCLKVLPFNRNVTGNVQ